MTWNRTWLGQKEIRRDAPCKKKFKKFCDRPKCDVGTNATQQQGYESFIL